MPTKKNQPSPFFRPLIGNALAHAWYHRELWPLAACAGLMGVGAGINDILTQARLSSVLPGTNPLTLLTSVSFINDLAKNLLVAGPQAVVISTLLLIFIGCISLIGIAWCQHTILRASHYANTHQTPLSLRQLAKDAAHPRIFRILTIDIFIKILIINIIVITGMLVSQLHPTTTFFDAFFGTIFSTCALIVAFGLNIWGMISLIHVVERNVSVLRGLEYAWSMITKHPVACIELSLLLFASTFGISLVAIAGLILIGSMGIPLFGIVISQGTLLGVAVVTFCSVLFATVWAVACAGFSTLVTYLSWSAFTQSCQETKKPLTSRGVIHAKRTLTHLFG